VARADLTGVLLLGGASTRFGSPKALARLNGESLAERAWRVLGEACTERLAVGKAADAVDLPFPVFDDGSETRAALAGIAAGLRVASTEVCVFLPVDMPTVKPALLLDIADSCAEADAAAPESSPLPAAYRRTALPVLERRLADGMFALHEALAELHAVRLPVDSAWLENVNTPDDLRRLG
jgi:molybdopterin-guanine dinucleotide biosynthesis protein A